MSTRRLIAVVLVALLGAFQVQAPLSSLNIFWRWAVLSYDSPATQVLDEFAAETDAPVPRLDESASAARLLVSDGVGLSPDDRLVARAHLAARASRSPPLS